MPKPTDEQRFLNTIARLARKQGGGVSKAALIGALGWANEKYEKYRALHIQNGKVKGHKGPGAHLSLTGKQDAPEPLRVFISYPHVDRDICKKLVSHLAPLVRAKDIAIWHDGEIRAGERWEARIYRELEQADVVVLLISADFLQSEFCYDKELERSLERADAGEAMVIPILVRDCAWKLTPLSQIQFAADDLRSFSKFSSVDEALTEAVLRIKKSLEGI